MYTFKSAIITIFLLFSTISFIYADQTLVFDLNPQEENDKITNKKDIVLNHQTLKSNAVVTTVDNASADKNQSLIGRIGMVKTDTAPIQRLPSSKAQNLYTCKNGNPLVIVSVIPNWYGVLMVDSSTGWVEQKRIEVLEYRYQAGQQPVYGESIGSSQLGNSIVNFSMKYLGIPYRWGGTTAKGLDCSAFVRSVFSQHGISLPRVAKDQAKVGKSVSWNDLQPGDRLYFACKGGAVDHAGIYMGNGMFIHSSTTQGGVGIDKITIPKFSKTLVTARR